MNSHEDITSKNSEKELTATKLASELKFGVESIHTQTYLLLERVEELVELYSRSFTQ